MGTGGRAMIKKSCLVNQMLLIVREPADLFLDYFLFFRREDFRRLDVVAFFHEKMKCPAQVKQLAKILGAQFAHHQMQADAYALVKGQSSIQRLGNKF